MTNPHPIAGIAFLLVASFLPLGWIGLAAPLSHDAERRANLDAIEAAQAAWEQRRPIAFSYRVNDGRVASYIVHVHGERRTAEFVETVFNGQPWRGPTNPVGIGEIFDLAQSTLQRDFSVQMELDPKYGYPVYTRLRPGCLHCDRQLVVSRFEPSDR